MENKKEKYMDPVLEIIQIECQDVITTSGGEDGYVDFPE